MNISTRRHRFVSFFLSFLLLFQSFAPAVVYATDEITPEPAPTEQVTPPIETIPTPEIIPEVPPSPEPNLEAVPDPSPIPTPPPPFVPDWQRLDDQTDQTVLPVAEGREYRFRDTAVTIRFSKLTQPGHLTVKEVKLSAEQVADLHAVSDIAYDLTSDMENGSFTYDLILPNPRPTETVVVKYSEDGSAYQEVPSQAEGDTVTILGLDHFTVFVLVNDLDTDNPDNLGDSDDVANGVLSTIADTFADQNSPNSTHGGSSDINVKSKSGNNNQRGFVQFNLASLPADISVSKATLRLFLTNAPASSRTYQAFRITGGWGENTLTWNNQPASAAAATAAVSTGTSNNVWLEWEVTADVQAFLDGDQTNYGWLIRDSAENSSNSRQGQFKSGNNATEIKRPQLVVDFTTAATEPTDYKSPTAQMAASGGDGDGFEVNPGNAFADGGGYAVNMNGAGDRHLFYNYDFAVPTGATINGLEVRADWYAESTSGTNSLSVELSWNGGVNWTAAKTDITETDKEHIVSFGGANNTWDHAWTPAELSNANFRVRVSTNSTGSNRDFYLDWIPVRIYYSPAPVDATPPIIEPIIIGTIGNDDWFVSVVDISWTVSDPESGIASTSGCDSVSLIDDTAGITLSCDAMNGAGLTNSGSVALKINKTKPSPPGIPTTTPNPTGSTEQFWNWLAASDNLSGVKGYYYSVSGDIFFDWTWLGDSLGVTTNLSNGIYRLWLKTEDNAGNESEEVQSEDLVVDTSAPEIVSLETQDRDANGYIDAIQITFTENIDDSRLQEGDADGWEVTGYEGEAIGTGDIENDNLLLLRFTEGTIPDTGVTPTVNYTSSGEGDDTSTHDLAGNELESGEWVPDDKAAPVLVSAITGDSGANGRIDRIVTVFSEDLDQESLSIDGFSVTDYIINGAFGDSDIVTLSLEEKETDNDTGAAPDVFIEEESVSDLADNWNLERSIISADGAAPVSTITSPESDTFHNSAINFAGTSSDSNGSGEPRTVAFVTLSYRPAGSEDDWTVIVSLENDGAEPFIWSYDWIPTAEGVYDLKASAADADGNLETSPTRTNIVYDLTAPESIITSPQNDGPDNIIYINDWDGAIGGTASDNEGGSGLARVELSIQRATDNAYWDGGNWVVLDGEEREPRVRADGKENWSYFLTEPGEDAYEITSHAIDNAGNTENSYKLTVVLDKTIPEVAISLVPANSDGGNGWYQTDPTITLTATDETLADRIEYQWDGITGVWTIYGLPFKTLGEGSHTLYYRAFDKAGNASGIGIRNIKYDKTDLTTGPKNVSVSPSPTSGNTAKVTWEAASDNVGIEKYEINWSLDGTSTSYTASVGNDIREREITKLDQEGKWNITVTAFDYAGNKKSASTELTVDRSAPVAPVLRLDGAGAGEATLGWNLVGDAVDYIIWYGNISGSYLFGARVGNINSFTIRGLGGGDYYFVVKSVDSAGNQSGYSNEVNTLALPGVPGISPETPAEGFSPEVRGVSTDITPTETITSSPEVLGESKSKNNFPLWLILIFITSGGLVSWAFWRAR